MLALATLGSVREMIDQFSEPLTLLDLEAQGMDYEATVRLAKATYPALQRSGITLPLERYRGSPAADILCAELADALGMKPSNARIT